MGDLSAHFSRSEFRCKHCGKLPPESQLRHLVGHLEQLRALVGRPMRIVSGYRCPQHPVEKRKRRPGRHYRPGAVDPVAGYCTVEQARAAGFRGVGVCRGQVVHIDFRRRIATFPDC